MITLCRIVASQPRRISAASVAARVAAERGSRLGEVVGFKIRFEDHVSAASRLLFCTVRHSVGQVACPSD